MTTLLSHLLDEVATACEYVETFPNLLDGLTNEELMDTRSMALAQAATYIAIVQAIDERA
jgi:hypothetical protein